MSALHDFCQVSLTFFEREVANLDHKIRSYFIVIFCWRVNILFFLKIVQTKRLLCLRSFIWSELQSLLRHSKIVRITYQYHYVFFFLEKDYSVVSYKFRRRYFCGTGAHSPRKNLSNLIFHLHDTIYHSDSVKYHSFLCPFLLRTWHGNQQILLPICWFCI